MVQKKLIGGISVNKFKCPLCQKPVKDKVLDDAMKFQTQRGKADTQVYTVTCPNCHKPFPFTVQDDLQRKIGWRLDKNEGENISPCLIMISLLDAIAALHKPRFCWHFQSRFHNPSWTLGWSCNFLLLRGGSPELHHSDESQEDRLFMWSNLSTDHKFICIIAFCDNVFYRHLHPELLELTSFAILSTSSWSLHSVAI